MWNAVSKRTSSMAAVQNLEQTTIDPVYMLPRVFGMFPGAFDETKDIVRENLPGPKT